MGKTRDDLADAFTKLYFGLIIAQLMVIAFVVMKTIELVVRVLKQYPDNKVLWGAIANFVLWATVAFGTEGYSQEVNALAVMSFLALAPVAKGVEVFMADEQLQPRVSRSNLLTAAMTQKWWNP